VSNAELNNELGLIVAENMVIRKPVSSDKKKQGDHSRLVFIVFFNSLF